MAATVWSPTEILTLFVAVDICACSSSLLSGNKLRGTIPGKWGYLRGIVRMCVHCNSLPLCILL